MKVSDYLPKLYNKNIEMNNIIYSEEEEFEKNIKLNIINSFKDNFIKTATLNGIEKYERMLGIIPDTSKDIEYRRSQIIFILYSTIPYTYKRLTEILDSYCRTKQL